MTEGTQRDNSEQKAKQLRQRIAEIERELSGLDEAIRNEEPGWHQRHEVPHSLRHTYEGAEDADKETAEARWHAAEQSASLDDVVALSPLLDRYKDLARELRECEQQLAKIAQGMRGE